MVSPFFLLVLSFGWWLLPASHAWSLVTERQLRSSSGRPLRQDFAQRIGWPIDYHGRCQLYARSSSSLTRCNLFTQTTRVRASQDELMGDATIQKPARRAKASKSAAATNRPRSISEKAWNDLASANLQLPFSCEFCSTKSSRQMQRFFTSTTTTTNGDAHRSSDVTEQGLTLRVLRYQDVKAVSDMCCREYGDEPTVMAATAANSIGASLAEVPKFTKELFDFVMLQILVEVSMFSKVPLLLPLFSSTGIPNDHVVLVASLGSVADSASATTKVKQSRETIVGMIEISRQPAMPERNPPAMPLPIWMKQAYCQFVRINESRKQQQTIDSSSSPPISPPLHRKPAVALEGWITNLLVAPEYRGCGLSKILVRACEGVARSWDVPAIHLHCDADSVSGRIPQALYMSCGYEKVPEENPEYAWMTAGMVGGGSGFPSSAGPTLLSSSVYVIDGVPLLYLRKDLA